MVKKIIETVAFILIKGNKFLVEKRKMDKCVDPGKIAIPSGGIIFGETPVEAVAREVKEELAITLRKTSFLCTLRYPHKKVDFNIHYFFVDDWVGKIISKEAEKLAWVKLANWKKLDLRPDQQAIKVLMKTPVFCIAAKKDKPALMKWFKSYKNKNYLAKRVDCYLSLYFTSLAKIDGRIVGVLQCLFKEDPSTGLAEFEEVRILNGFKRKGIGTELLKFSIEEVKRRFKEMHVRPRKIVLFVSKPNIVAQKFYEKNGFKLESEVGFLFTNKKKELFYSLDLRQKK